MNDSERLKEWLRVTGMTGAELARRSGVGQSTISMWASGRRIPGMQSVRRIAQAFGVSIDEYIQGPSEQENTSMYRESAMRDELHQIVSGLTGEELREAHKVIRKMYGDPSEKKSAS